MGIKAEALEAFFDAADILPKIGNDRLATLAHQSATTGLFMSIGLCLQDLSTRGNADAWLLFREHEFEGSPPEMGKYLSSVAKCLSESGEEYAGRIGKLAELRLLGG